MDISKKEYGYLLSKWNYFSVRIQDPFGNVMIEGVGHGGIHKDSDYFIDPAALEFKHMSISSLVSRIKNVNQIYLHVNNLASNLYPPVVKNPCGEIKL